MTQWVIGAHFAAAEANKQAWMQASWENGAASQAHLTELRVRADAYRAVGETSYEQFCDMLGEEPRDE